MKKTITLILAASALTLALGATACNTGGISLGGTDRLQYGRHLARRHGRHPRFKRIRLRRERRDGGDAHPVDESRSTRPLSDARKYASDARNDAPRSASGTLRTTAHGARCARHNWFCIPDGYMGLVDSFLNGSGYSVEVTDSSRAEYDEMMKISYSGLNGSTKYEMHYNKMLIPDFDDDDRWEEEEEEEYALKGVLVIDGIEYPVQGVREIERERGEYESETQFRVTLEDGRSVWVEQSESSEKDEHELEYSYLIRENGRVVERSSFSFEEEKGETELEMITERDGKREVFCFEEETYRGKEYITLRIGSGINAMHSGEQPTGCSRFLCKRKPRDSRGVPRRLQPMK